MRIGEHSRETATVLEESSRKFEALTTEAGVHPTLVTGVNTDDGRVVSSLSSQAVPSLDAPSNFLMTRTAPCRQDVQLPRDKCQSYGPLDTN